MELIRKPNLLFNIGRLQQNTRIWPVADRLRRNLHWRKIKQFDLRPDPYWHSSCFPKKCTSKSSVSAPSKLHSPPPCTCRMHYCSSRQPEAQLTGKVGANWTTARCSDGPCFAGSAFLLRVSSESASTYEVCCPFSWFHYEYFWGQ
jgi:hypothetical protein